METVERRRRHYRVDLKEHSDGYGNRWTTESRNEDPDGNLVSSLLEGSDLHAPVIDLDMPHRLIPSSTKGHAHLYIDQAITWRQYKRILRALYKAGLIQEGWYEHAKRDRKSYVRREGVYKSAQPLKGSPK